MKISRNWLQSYFEKEIPQVEDLDHQIALHAFETEGIETVEDDQVIDIDVLPNRAHDCLSHQGIAQEVAAIFELPMKSFGERYHDQERLSSDLRVEAEIDPATKTKRAMMCVVENVKVGESPDWLKKRLAAVGQRSINNIVDITNYVMFDTGKPVHAFDYDKLAGGDAKNIRIVFAKQGEKITALNEEMYELDESMVVIHDGEKPMDIAGVKGGADTGVDENTTRVLLTSCSFDPLIVRQMTRALKLHSDASKRFENEQTPEYAERGLKAMIALMTDVDISGTKSTKVGEITDVYPGKVDQSEVSVSLLRINTILGLSLSVEDVVGILNRLQFQHTVADENFNVTVPHERLDIGIADDLVEEVGRIYGYTNIPSVDVSSVDFLPQVNKNILYQNKVRDVLLAEGFSEVMTYSFQKKGSVEVANPVAKDKPALRKNLIKGMSEALEKNVHNAELFGGEVVRIFEFGTVFTKKDDRVVEELHLALAVESKTKQARKKHGDARTQIETVVKKISEKCDIDLSRLQVEGAVAEVDFGEALQSLPLLDAYENLDVDLSGKKFVPFSLQPFVVRDIALWVGADVEAATPLARIQEVAGDLLVRIDLFDQFEKDGKVSYAYRLIFQSMDKTLSDDEVGGVMKDIESTIAQEGWEVR